MLEADTLAPKLVDISSNLDLPGNCDVITTLLRDVITMTTDLHQPGTNSASTAHLEKVFKCAQQPYDILYSEFRP